MDTTQRKLEAAERKANEEHKLRLDIQHMRRNDMHRIYQVEQLQKRLKPQEDKVNSLIDVIRRAVPKDRSFKDRIGELTPEQWSELNNDIDAVERMQQRRDMARAFPIGSGFRARMQCIKRRHIEYFGDHNPTLNHPQPGTKERFFGVIDTMLKEYYGVPMDKNTGVLKATQMLKVKLPPEHPMHTLEWTKGILEDEDEYKKLHELFREECEGVTYIGDRPGPIPIPVTWLSYSKYLGAARKAQK